ncbi:MAG: Txe/YoeB family addiction module toxin [Symploca sp. SIO2D2]|nr:Txe/YoeB family addiction module toxin [Symploca sp. SIO2D2]
MAKKKKFQRDSTAAKQTPKSESYHEENSELDLVFDVKFIEDLSYWVETNRKIALRLLSLVEEIRRNPFEGTGKPERLRYQDVNVWSRRLTEKDRVVYAVSNQRIDFLQARYHYSDR